MKERIKPINYFKTLQIFDPNMVNTKTFLGQQIYYRSCYSTDKKISVMFPTNYFYWPQETWIFLKSRNENRIFLYKKADIDKYGTYKKIGNVVIRELWVVNQEIKEWSRNRYCWNKIVGTKKEKMTLKEYAKINNLNYRSELTKRSRDKKKLELKNMGMTQTKKVSNNIKNTKSVQNVIICGRNVNNLLKQEIIQPRGIYNDLWPSTPINKGYVSTKSEFCTINPLIQNSTTAKDDNVASRNCFLFEFDSISLNDQVRYAKMNLDKINRIVFSGSKSLHCRITIADEPENKVQYKFIWNQLNDYLFDSKADKACSNPARLTRMPNAIRDNGIEQTRLWLTETIYNWDWREAFKSEQLKLLYEYKCLPNSGNKNTAEELLKRNIPEETRKLLSNNFKDGERHQQIWKAISFLQYIGWNKEQVLPYVKNTGIKDYEGVVNYVY